jgi:all-trans-retinol dehydrogenase (NAD+)
MSLESIAGEAWLIHLEVGDPTILVNTVGTGKGFCKPLFEESEAAIRATFDANTAAMLLVKQFVPRMVYWNHGHVVTVASMESFMVTASSIGYECTRAATLAVHEGLKQELKASNVRST